MSLLFSSWVVAQAAILAEVFHSSIRMHSIQQCNAFRLSLSEPEEVKGQLQVHFSSHKNPYTSVFLRGLEKIPWLLERQAKGRRE